MEDPVRDRLADRFRHFAEKECHDSSPLYAAFARQVAADDDLLELASHCRMGQPPANLLFAAVQDLLLRGVADPLREFYPALSDPFRSVDELGDEFRSFCRDYSEEIRSIIELRLVQTNEVRRCVFLQAAFAAVMERMGDQPMALIELGPSAALNLCWDRYDYGALGWGGDSELRLETEWRGERRPPKWNTPPQVVHRAGVDLNVIDLEDEAERRWLKALIWPEHLERHERMERALRIARKTPMKLEEGNAIEWLPRLLSETPDGPVPCVFHTYVANQMSPAERNRLMALIDEAGSTRDLCHLFNNIEGHLQLTYYLNGQRYDVPLARTDGHARWVEWLA